MSSLEERLLDVDPRVRTTRAGFYRALMEWKHGVEANGLPRQDWLQAEARSPESTFRSHFGSDRYPDLQPCAGQQLSGVVRVVMETKVLALDPFVRGYREASTRLHSPAPVRLSALVRIVLTWALKYRALAAMAPGRLPDSVERACRELAGSGPGAEATYAEIRELLGDAVAAVPGLPDDATPGETLATWRARISEVLPLEDDLRRASRELAAHIGSFMLLCEPHRGEVDPELGFVLERALRSLRTAAEVV